MSMQELIARLKDRPKGPVNAEQLKAEWTGALESVFAQIESWLKPATKAGVLKTRRTEAEIDEADLGSYAVPVLEVRDDKGVVVRFEPLGARIVALVTPGGRRVAGLRGRVNIVCGPMRVPMVRTEFGWKVFTLRGEEIDLNEESLSLILREVLLNE